MSAALDDATVAYVLETRRHFEDLRQVCSQLAGLLVLVAAGSESAGPHHPLLESADRLHQEAADGVARARATDRSRRHHTYLARASAELRIALDAARSGREIDLVLAPLRRAYDALQAASRELPGFEMVSFEMSCCGGKS